MTTENQPLREAYEKWRKTQVFRPDYATWLSFQAGAALTPPAQPAEGGEAREFFAYHSDMGVEFFNGPDAEAAAKSLCDENLKLERAEAISTDEWADDRAESIRWGVVLGRAKFFENPGQEGEDSGDYKMAVYTAPPASQEQLEHEYRKGFIDGQIDMRASQEQAQQPSGGEAVAWRVEVKPVAVLGLEGAHKITARIGNQSFHIGPDYLDSKQDAEVFAACFEHALKVGATPKPEPMTDEQVLAINARYLTCLECIRATEAHHGITKEQA